MAQQTVNIGSVANDGNGDTGRVAFDKVNDNFGELFTELSLGSPEVINIGSQPNDGTGDTVRAAFYKVNTNFIALYTAVDLDTRQAIGIGSVPNDKTGDQVRVAFDKINDNFTEVYAEVDQNIVIDLADEGVAAGNSAAANFSAITTLRDTLVASDDTAHYEFHWPAGVIQVSDPRGFAFLFWQKHVAHASGTTFESTHASLKIPFRLGDILSTTSLTTFPPDVNVMGDLFNTAVAGASSITCTTAADAAAFTTGMRVILSGFDQQHGAGYPPNPRWDEYKVVAAPGGNGTTGVVSFTTVLQYSYDSEWYEVADHLGLTAGVTMGKPRILSLDRGDEGFFAEYVEFNGPFTFKDHSTAALTGTLLVPGDTLLIDGITLQGNCWPSCNRSFESHNCSFEAFEPDKMCNVGLVEDFTIAEDMAGGTGFHDLTFRRGVVAGNCFSRAKTNLLEDITIGGNLGGTGQNSPCILTIDSLIFTGVANDRVTEPEFQTVTIDEVDGNDLEFDDNGSLSVFDQVKEGTWMWKSDGSKYGKVGRVGIDDEAGNYRIEWDTYVGAAPVAAETWIYDYCRIIDLGGHTCSGRMWNVTAARFAGRAQPVDGAWETVWTQADMSFTANRVIPFYGRVDKITVAITGAYSGDDAAHEIWLVPIDGGTALKFNCKITGTRVVDREGASITGAQSGDSLDLANVPTWTTTMNTRMRNGTSGFPTDLTPAAVFTITIRWKDVSQF